MNLSEIGIFINQLAYSSILIIVAAVIYQGYQWIKAKVEISKIKAERERVKLESSKPKELEELQDVPKPNTASKRIESSLKKMFSKGKQGKNKN